MPIALLQLIGKPEFAEANPDLRTSMSEKAKQLNRNGATDGAIMPVNDNSAETLQFGPLGLGDVEFPISEDILKASQKYKAFINRSHALWVKKNSNIIHDLKLPPAPKDRKARSDALEAQLRLPLGLLYDILRLMRELHRKMNKESIQSSAKWPLLLVKRNGKMLGWCLARAMFRPLAVWGLRIREDDLSIATLPESLILDLQQDYLPIIDDMDAIAIRMLHLGGPLQDEDEHEDDPEFCSFALPQYKFKWESPMSQLHLIGTIQWRSWKAGDVVEAWEASTDGDDSDGNGGSDSSDKDEKDEEADKAMDLLRKASGLLTS